MKHEVQSKIELVDTKFKKESLNLVHLLDSFVRKIVAFEDLKKLQTMRSF